ncbi:unnamed protein product, partial [Iphiclides podalirius]
MTEKRCCVPECNVTRGDQITLHTFPNPDKEPDRFRSWIYAVKGDILSLDNQIIYKRRRVCHNHFETKYHTWTRSLSPNAVPTLNLPGMAVSKKTLLDR